MEYLNYREKGGYSLEKECFHPAGKSELVEVFVFRATPQNTLFVENESPSRTAEIIAKSVGPSGENKEYFLRLIEWHRKTYPHIPDQHLEELFNKLTN